VANTIRLAELEEPIREMISKGQLNGGHGKALLGAPSGQLRIELATKASDEGWSVRRVERAATELVLDHMDKEAYTRRVGPHAAAVMSPSRAARLDLEKQLSEHLGTKVTITSDKEARRGKLILEFYSLDHFDGLTAKMGFHAR
jgi:ParB family chromosome partitioning protein